MHKKLAANLTSLAHSVLQMKNKEDILILKEKAYEIYEKLVVLAYVEEYINTTPNARETRGELLSKIENASKSLKIVPEENKMPIEITTPKGLEVDIAPILEQPFDALGEILFEDIEEKETEDKEDKPEKKILSLEEELQGTISVDIAADLFEKKISKKSLNDQLQTDVFIGLNDRIAFVTNLFDGSQEDFNRVLSQLNSFKTEEETKNFINEMVKPDYNWKEKEALEERFVNAVTFRFG